jgi:hypothetical protein
MAMAMAMGRSGPLSMTSKVLYNHTERSNMAKGPGPILALAGIAALFFMGKKGGSGVLPPRPDNLNLHTITSMDDLSKLQPKREDYKGMVAAIGVSSVRATIQSELAEAAADNRDVFFVFIDVPPLEIEQLNAVAMVISMGPNTDFQQIVMEVPDGTPPTPATDIASAIAAAIGKL